MLTLDRERLAQAIKRQRAAQAAEYFRANAAQWDRIRSLHIDDNEVEAALVQLLPPDGIHDLLDIGTGTGRMLEVFGTRVERAVGVDLSREMLAVARANLERADRRQLLGPPGRHVPAAAGRRLLRRRRHPPGAALRRPPRRGRSPRRRACCVPAGGWSIIDFAPHALEYLRTDHAHRRLGFADAEIIAWCRAAGLEPAPVRICPAIRSP